MKMKKKMLCKISIVASLVLLFTSGLANASVLSPYNNAKEALKKSVTANDISVEGIATTTYENQSYQEIWTKQIDGGEKSYDSYIKPDYRFDQVQIGATVYNYWGTEEDGSPIYYEYDSYYDLTGKGLLGMTDQQIRLVEIMLDTFSSNSKDYLQEREEDGKKIIYGTLDTSQIPEVVHAAFSYSASLSADRGITLTGGANEFPDFNRKTAAGLKNIYVQEITGECVINEQGYMTDMDITVQLVFVTKADEKLVVTSNQKISFYDIGTTDIAWPFENITILSGEAQTSEIIELDEQSQQVLDRIDQQIDTLEELFLSGEYTEEQLEEFEKLLEDFYQIFE